MSYIGVAGGIEVRGQALVHGEASSLKVRTLINGAMISKCHERAATS